MKYPSSFLALFVFVAAMVWSWKVIHSDAPVSFETHSGIQERLIDLIQSTIKATKPTAADIKIHQVWTEVISANKLKAHFKYSFHEQGDSGPLTTQIAGEGILERQNPEDSSNEDRWTLSKVHTSSDSIVFEDGLIVTADKNAAPAVENKEDKKEEGTEEAKHE